MNPALDAPAQALPPLESSDVQGKVIVTYPSQPSNAPAVRRRLSPLFTLKEEKSDGASFFEEPIQSWLESEPSRRSEFFKAAVAPQADDAAWSQRPLRPILEAMVQGMEASVQESEVLPFHLLTFEFHLRVSGAPKEQNSAGHLISVAQACRDLTRWMLGDAASTVGQVVTVTSQQRSSEQMRTLCRQVDQLRSLELSHEVAPTEDVSEDLEDPPLGAKGSGMGFSHYRIARNVHVVVAPDDLVVLNGPGWLVGIYGESSRHGAGPGGTRAAEMVDPLQFRRVVEAFDARPSGLPVFLALWRWVGDELGRVRQAHKRTKIIATRLARAAWRPSSWRAWKQVHQLEAQVRESVHALRGIEDVYGFSLEGFLRQAGPEGRRELWIPPGGLVNRSVPQERGTLYETVQGFQRELGHARNVAEEAWETIAALKQDYAIRLQYLTSIGILLLTIVLFAVPEDGPLRQVASWAWDRFGQTIWNLARLSVGG